MTMPTRKNGDTQMTDDRTLDDLIEETERVQKRQLENTNEQTKLINSARSTRSRREIIALIGTGGVAAAGGAILVPMLATAKPSADDAKTVALAIKVELFAVGAYTAAAAAAKKLGLTKGQVDAGKLFASHHAAHAKAEQDFLKSLKADAPTTPLKSDAELKMIGLSNAAVKEAFKSGPGVLTAALYVEEVAAKTYSDFAVKTKDRTVSDFAWSIAPVEESHATYLRAALAQPSQEAAFAGSIKPIPTSQILAAASMQAVPSSPGSAMPSVTG